MSTTYDRALGKCGHITRLRDEDVAERWFSAPNSVYVKCTQCAKDVLLAQLYPAEAPMPRARGPHQSLAVPEPRFGYTKVEAFPPTLRRYRITLNRRRLGIAESDTLNDEGWRAFNVHGQLVGNGARYGSLAVAAHALLQASKS